MHSSDPLSFAQSMSLSRAALALLLRQMSLHDASKLNLESLALKWAKAIRKKGRKRIRDSSSWER